MYLLDGSRDHSVANPEAGRCELVGDPRVQVGIVIIAVQLVTKKEKHIQYCFCFCAKLNLSVDVSDIFLSIFVLFFKQ
jgi:hypothetical protein